MKNLKRALLCIFLTLPLGAFAHGEEILFVFYSTAVSIIICLIILYFINLKIVGKFILWIVYIITIGLLFYSLKNINYGEYLDKITLINLRLFFIPALTVTLAYFLIRSKFKKIN